MNKMWLQTPFKYFGITSMLIVDARQLYSIDIQEIFPVSLALQLLWFLKVIVYGIRI